MDISERHLTASLAADAHPRRVLVIRPPVLALDGLVQAAIRLFHYRDLLYTLSLHRVNVRYKQSFLGVAWAIVQPVSLMLIYTLLFSYILNSPSPTGVPYAIFAYAALLPWTFFSTSLSNATSALVSHSQLITKVYFPREILPISYIVASLVDLSIASIFYAALVVYYRISLTANAFYVVPIIIVLACFSLAISLISAATQVRYRDIGVAMPLILQLWMFATPVVYPLSAVPERFRTLYNLNPMAGLIENFRRVTLYGDAPAFPLLMTSGTISVTLLIVAWVYFKHVEATLSDVI